MSAGALGSALARGLALALAAAAIVGLRILERGEALSPRTTLVVALFGAAGLVAGVAATILLRLLEPASARRRVAVGALVGLVLLPGVAFVLFAIDRNGVEVVRSFRQDGLVSTLRHALIGLTIDAAGAFAVTARPYLLPWPLAAMGACAMLALAPARRTAAIAVLAAACLVAGTDRPARAQDDDWTREKCRRYTAAWAEATRRLGTEGISAQFVARHDAFLASGCTAPADVCPRSEAELALANVMVILAMNAGTASTFPPFACRD
ncbi:hypothetical protein [Salinarimonas rosea]|uniref:hypothetical protein n=1 Tax=Salinarimonas rosea TaxID=552063 RepID=UPI000420CAAA|nr:hypothetical protein [Salinarimonas rosea]